MQTQNRLYMIDIQELEADGCFDKWYAKMPAYRQDKIDSIKPENGKLLSLGAGILLDKAMNDIGIAEYEISTGEKGKPYVKGYDGVFFNISHSGRRSVLAVSDKEIGVDIQETEHFKESLSNRVFCEEERLLAQKSSDIDMFYTRMWTMKEAVMKHSGLGFYLEPENITLTCSNGRFVPICGNYRSGRLLISEYKLEGYALSVCSSYDFSRIVNQPEYVHPG